jgi:hypothetical protein
LSNGSTSADRVARRSTPSRSGRCCRTNRADSIRTGVTCTNDGERPDPTLWVHRVGDFDTAIHGVVRPDRRSGSPQPRGR